MNLDQQKNEDRELFLMKNVILSQVIEYNKRLKRLEKLRSAVSYTQTLGLELVNKPINQIMYA